MFRPRRVFVRSAHRGRRERFGSCGGWRRMRARTLQHAAAAGAARVGQQLRPSVGMRGEKAVDQALDPFGIRAVPMTKAMQRAFRAGKRFEIENCGHHIQGGAMKGLAVFQAGAAVHRHDVLPHVADCVEGRAAGLVKMRQMGRTARQE